MYGFLGRRASSAEYIGTFMSTTSLVTVIIGTTLPAIQSPIVSIEAAAADKSSELRQSPSPPLYGIETSLVIIRPQILLRPKPFMP